MNEASQTPLQSIVSDQTVFGRFSLAGKSLVMQSRATRLSQLLAVRLTATGSWVRAWERGYVSIWYG